ncbi:thiamine-phosphate kinase [Novosphingobium sp. M1R2S20]|uniref:Thiamine-monophosphate kinase n=1 Tax=Novosphingobium rhizovicinum TaxID=3228928 RepID=A0ABV3RDE0_9SPHN
MTSEAAFIRALRAIATDPAARGLTDDAAVLELGGARLVLTMDAICEDVHFLADDPPATVAWKLVATNVSDLAAKGAEPRGCLLSYALTDADAWNEAFLQGLQQACEFFAIPLLGGDTVRPKSGAGRNFALVAFGEPRARMPVPSRSGARSGDTLWLSAPVGDAGAGLALLQGKRQTDSPAQHQLVDRYRKPMPRVDLGVALAPYVTTMMDVSDGVLIDSERLASASELAAVIQLDKIPLSPAFAEVFGEDLEARLFAASAGDDYCLLFTAASDAAGALERVARNLHSTLYPVGHFMEGKGISLMFDDVAVATPDRLGFEH